jgi:hypothetical protein
MIIMSWSPATHDNVIVCDTRLTTKTESVLLDFNHFEYSGYSFIWVYD